jgi:hypothetical protein
MVAYLIEENRVLRRQVGSAPSAALRSGSAEARRAGLPARPAGLAQRRNDRHAGHVAPLAPAAHRPQMDLRQGRNTPLRHPHRNPRIGRADGGGESDVGVHADPGRAEESWASCRTFNDCADSAGERNFARTGASHIVADVPASHWGEIAGADFFTTEVWTWRGLVTFYTVFVIEFASRRVQILGSACGRARRSRSSTPTPGWLAQLLRASGVRTPAAFGASAGH